MLPWFLYVYIHLFDHLVLSIRKVNYISGGHTVFPLLLVLILHQEDRLIFFDLMSDKAPFTKERRSAKHKPFLVNISKCY